MKETIVLIDDDPVCTHHLKTALGQIDAHFEIYQDGESFLATFVDRPRPPSIVILDIMMPGISGLGVLANIRERYTRHELPVIMLSSKTDATDIIHALESGASDYISKPPHPGIAQTRVKTQLELRNLYIEDLKRKEIETINALVATYCHEINNPLTILKLSYQKPEKLSAATEAIDRITRILNRIHKLTDKNAKRTKTDQDKEGYYDLSEDD